MYVCLCFRRKTSWALRFGSGNIPRCIRGVARLEKSLVKCAETAPPAHGGNLRGALDRIASLSATSQFDPFSYPKLTPPQSNSESAVALRSQLELWHKRLETDRVLIYRDKVDEKTRDWKRRASTKSDKPVPHVGDVLKQSSVDEVLASVASDAGRDPVQARLASVGDSLAVHVDQIISSRQVAKSPLYRKLPSLTVVRALVPKSPVDQHMGIFAQESLRHVFFLAPVSGIEPDLHPAKTRRAYLYLQKRLNAIVPDVSAALARKLMLSLAPKVRLIFWKHDAKAEAMRVPTSQAKRRRARQMQYSQHQTVHSAMGKFARNMSWD